MKFTSPHGKGIFARRWWLRSHATGLPQNEQPSRMKKTLAASRYRLRKLRRLAPRYLWLCRYDIGFLLLVNALAGILALWAPIYRVKERKFPIWYDPDREGGVWYGPTSISQPKMESETISSLNTAIVCVAIPLLCLFLVQAFVRDFWDAHSAKFAFLKAIALMTLVQEIFKRFIARPRPYFMTECFSMGGVRKLDLFQTRYSPQWVTIEACETAPSKAAWQSYPSGHTGTAFAAATVLALYLNAKLKAFSNYHTHFAKQLAVVIPFIGALFISTAMIVDKHHHPSDVLLSIPLGILCALAAYRSHYHSLFDYRNNHVPLPYRRPSRWSDAFKSQEPPSQTTYGVVDNEKPKANDQGPEQYVAVNWPLRGEEKRGPVAKEQQLPESPASPAIVHPAQHPGSDGIDLDGTSRDAVWSMSRASGAPASYRHARGSPSLGRASTIVSTPSRRRTESADGASTIGQSPSVRDREVVGSGTGSEAMEMV